MNDIWQTKRFLPNLFILGAAKCGTTSLHAYLDAMPDVCMSSPKEPFFFEAEFEKGLEFYRQKYFAHWKGEPIIGEARHRNLILPYIPERIHSINPDAKLVVIARDPVKRSYSHWYHNYIRNSESLNFNKAIQADYERIQKGLICDTQEEIKAHIQNLPRKKPGMVIGLGLYRTYLDSGYYYAQIQRYLQLFPQINIKLIIFEDFIDQPQKVVEALVEFLNLDPNINKFENEIWINKALVKKSKKKKGMLHKPLKKLKKKIFFNRSITNTSRNLPQKKIADYDLPPMDEEIKAWLKDHYREKNRQIEKLFNIRIEQWK